MNVLDWCAINIGRRCRPRADWSTIIDDTDCDIIGIINFVPCLITTHG